jgi:hypothetical protein
VLRHASWHAARIVSGNALARLTAGNPWKIALSHGTRRQLQRNHRENHRTWAQKPLPPRTKFILHSGRWQSSLGSTEHSSIKGCGISASN